MSTKSSVSVSEKKSESSQEVTELINNWVPFTVKCEENWDDDYAPTYNPTEACADRQIRMGYPDTAIDRSKAARNQHKQKERLRWKQLTQKK